MALSTNELGVPDQVVGELVVGGLGEDGHLEQVGSKVGVGAESSMHPLVDGHFADVMKVKEILVRAEVFSVSQKQVIC